MVNTTIDMDNNNGNSDGKNGKDGFKDDEEYGDDGDDDDDEDDDNDDGGDNDDKNNNATDSEESDNGKGENDGIVSATSLDERFYAAIDSLRNKWEKVDIEYGFPGLVVPKKVTNKETTELIFLCCHNKCGQFHLENCTVLRNCYNRYWIIDSTASYSCLEFLRLYFFEG